MSRIVEWLIVRNHIFPAIPTNEILDHYGFKPSGSTTAALVDLTHKISDMLEDNKYVRCLLIDISRAFHSVGHLILVSKLKALNIADNIMQWVVQFSTDRNQFVKVSEMWSFTKFINRSIVQGSGIGPTLFIICIADLRPTGSTNYITKYADDSSLLVPENHDVGLYDELNNVLKNSEVNKIHINMAKTKEIVFHRPNARNVLLPSELPAIERVLFAKLLGVWLQADMGMKTHVVHICNLRTYLLKQLKRQ